MQKIKIKTTVIGKSQGDEGKTIDSVFLDVDLAEAVKDIDKIVIKINLVVAEPYDLGSVSDPFVLGKVIEKLREVTDVEIVIAESETAWCTELLPDGFSQKKEQILKGFVLAMQNSGTKELAEKYSKVRILDVTEAPKASVDEIKKRVAVKYPSSEIDTDMLGMVPKEFLEERVLLINYTKMKTHKYSTITMTCKNLFGFITIPNKVPFHDGGKGLAKSILSINLIYNAIFDKKIGVAECLRYAIEGDGPDTETGTTKLNAGLILVGDNLLEIDTIGSHLMGFDPKNIPYLKALEKCYLPVVVDFSDIPEKFITPFVPPTKSAG